MNTPSIKFIYAGGAVKRFHTTNTLKEDNVAQHSFGVAWMVWKLTFGGAGAPLIMAALAHDLAEQFTGDVPAPAKRALGISSQFHRYEREIELNNQVFFHLTDDDRRVLKIADCLDGLARCAIEISMGNKRAEFSFNNYAAYLEELGTTAYEKTIIAEITALKDGLCNTEYYG